MLSVQRCFQLISSNRCTYSGKLRLCLAHSQPIHAAQARAFNRVMTAHTNPAQAIDFLTLLHNLKKTKRTGWIRRDVAGAESIADHMYRMSMMALLGSDSGVDTNRCIKLAITHDVAEAIVGDIAPSDNISKEVKNQLEAEAVLRIKDMLGAETAAGQEVQNLWQEYEDGQTAEAIMVKDFDKLEMILQAQEYEADQGMDLQEFFDSTAGKFRTPLGQAWAKEIIKRRPNQQSINAVKLTGQKPAGRQTTT